MRLPRLILIAVSCFAVLASCAIAQDIQPINQHDCETCGCQGLADDGPMVMASGRVIKIWIDEGTLGQFSKSVTRRLLLKGVKEFDERCGLDFVVVEKRHQAKVKVSFVKSATWLGFSWSSGRIQLNSGRSLSVNEDSRVSEAVIGHELGHVFGLVHGGGRSDIMNADLGYYWSPAEVRRLQQLHGKPEANDKPFYPILRSKVGKKIRDIKRKQTIWRERRAVLIDRRTQLVKDGKWSATTGTHLEIVKLNGYLRANNANLIKLNKEWFAENSRWRGVNGAVTF